MCVLQAPANVRLVIIFFYPQDNTIEMIESKETACPGVGRSFALRRPSRVPLDDIRVGSDVLVSLVGKERRSSLKWGKASDFRSLPPTRPTPNLSKHKTKDAGVSLDKKHVLRIGTCQDRFPRGGIGRTHTGKHLCGISPIPQHLYGICGLLHTVSNP